MTKEEKQIFLEFGHIEEDMWQLNECLKHCKLKLNDKRISHKKAKDILGLRTFFRSGISRACFHWSSYREDENGNGILFDFSDFFKEVC